MVSSRLDEGISPLVDGGARMTQAVQRWERQESPETLDLPILGRIEGCTHPESAELLPDGERFVFGNCAMTLGVQAYRAGAGLVYLDEQAFISVGRIGPDRSVSLVERRRISGLTATLGCDVVRRGSARFPVGTVFMAGGGNPVVRPGEQALIDPAQTHSQLLAFDPAITKVSGSIALWHGSPLAKRYNPIDQPNGLAVNAAGDLFFGDIPNGNPATVLPPPVPSAVYRIPCEAIDGLAAGDSAAATGVQRVLMPGFVNGVTVSPVDDSVWVVSCSSHDPAGGALYRLGKEDFASGVLPSPAIQGLGVLDGVSITRRGTVFVSNPRTGQTHALLADGSHRVVLGAGKPLARNPADINVCYPAALRGEPALLIPDVSVAAGPTDGTVTVLDIRGL
jgi:hypothetical protein